MPVTDREREVERRREEQILRHSGAVKIAQAIGLSLLEIDKEVNTRGVLARMRRRAMGEPASLSTRKFR